MLPIPYSKFNYRSSTDVLMLIKPSRLTWVIIMMLDEMLQVSPYSADSLQAAEWKRKKDHGGNQMYLDKTI